MISPEDLQYLLGTHPEQLAAQAAQIPQDEIAAPGAPGAEARPAPVLSPSTGSHRISTAPITISPRADIIPHPKPEIGPQEPEPEADVNAAGKTGGGSISDLLRSPIRPIISEQQQEQQHLRGREATDRAELERLQNTGSGVSQFAHRHHILGPIVRGLDIAGTALAPGLAAAIPGTEMHHRELMGQQRERVEQDISDQAKHSAMADRDESIRIRDQAERDRETQNAAMNDLRQQAQDTKDRFRHISYDRATGQFMRGGEIYTPKDFQEGAVLETQHGVVNGPYTQKWMAERRNQAPQTHVHTPSAAEEMYQDWRNSFHDENGRWPNAKEIDEYRRGGGRGGAGKDYTSLRVQAESRKEAELDKLERQHAHDLALAGTDADEKKRLSEALEANKARVQRAYEAELAQIPAGEQQPPSRINPQAQPPAAAAPPAPPAKPAAAQQYKPGDPVIVDGKKMYVIGYGKSGKPIVSVNPPRQ